MKLTRNHHGFTLMELLIAITAGVMVVGIAMGIYRSVAQAESRLNRFQEEFFSQVQATHLLRQLLLYQTGVVCGSPDKIVFLSDLNLLGYGRELIRISGGNQNSTILTNFKIVPVIFAGSDSDMKKIIALYENTDPAYTYSHQETIKGFIPQFFYRYEGNKTAEILGKKPDCLKIILRQGNFNEWIVAKSWE